MMAVVTTIHIIAFLLLFARHLVEMYMTLTLTVVMGEAKMQIWKWNGQMRHHMCWRRLRVNHVLTYNVRAKTNTMSLDNCPDIDPRHLETCDLTGHIYLIYIYIYIYIYILYIYNTRTTCYALYVYTPRALSHWAMMGAKRFPQPM